MPRLRRSVVLGIGSQPCRAGLMFGNGPTGRGNAETHYRANVPWQPPAGEHPPAALFKGSLQRDDSRHGHGNADQPLDYRSLMQRHPAFVLRREQEN